MSSHVVGNRDSWYESWALLIQKPFVHLLGQILSSAWSQVQVPEMVSQFRTSHPLPTPVRR